MNTTTTTTTTTTAAPAEPPVGTLVRDRAARMSAEARAADEWEEQWRRVARQPLGPTDETEAWEIARYTLVGRTPLDKAEATKLASAYLRLLAQVGRAGLPEED